MRIRRLVFTVLLGAGLGSAAAADPILGTWQVAPDHKGQVGHVVIRRCQDAFCGRVMTVFDRTGKGVVTRSMGRDLFWDLKPKGNGRYDRGRDWVPLHDRVYPAKAPISGDQLIVRGCVGPICDGQTWIRVR